VWRETRAGARHPALELGNRGCYRDRTTIRAQSAALHQGESEAGTGERPRAQVEFQLGESVKVTSGPLSDFDGEIVDVNADQQKLKVLVDIFERQVPVELSFDQVKKID